MDDYKHLDEIDISDELGVGEAQQLPMLPREFAADILVDASPKTPAETDLTVELQAALDAAVKPLQAIDRTMAEARQRTKVLLREALEAAYQLFLTARSREAELERLLDDHGIRRTERSQNPFYQILRLVHRVAHPPRDLPGRVGDRERTLLEKSGRNFARDYSGLLEAIHHRLLATSQTVDVVPVSGTVLKVLERHSSLRAAKRELLGRRERGTREGRKVDALADAQAVEDWLNATDLEAALRNRAEGLHLYVVKIEAGTPSAWRALRQVDCHAVLTEIERGDDGQIAKAAADAGTDSEQAAACADLSGSATIEKPLRLPEKPMIL